MTEPLENTDITPVQDIERILFCYLPVEVSEVFGARDAKKYVQHPIHFTRSCQLFFGVFLRADSSITILKQQFYRAIPLTMLSGTLPRWVLV